MGEPEPEEIIEIDEDGTVHAPLTKAQLRERIKDLEEALLAEAEAWQTAGDDAKGCFARAARCAHIAGKGDEEDRHYHGDELRARSRQQQLAGKGDPSRCLGCGGPWPCHRGCVSGDPLAGKDRATLPGGDEDTSDAQKPGSPRGNC